MRRTSAVWVLFIVVFCANQLAQPSEIYKWTDENGTTHFSTSLHDVPEKYRGQFETLKSDTTDLPEATMEPPPENQAPPLAAATAGDVDASPVSFEVPYKAFEGSARRVIIPVTFNNSVTAPMALDTGSPGMVISFELAERLRLFSLDRGTLVIEASGIGGSLPAILTIVDSVSVDRARANFVPTTVTASLSEEFQGLIGMDFVANYTVSIDSLKEVVVFTENPPRPNARGGHDEAWWRKNFKQFRAASDHWRERAESRQGRTGSKTTEFIEFQAREAERLLRRLDNYASDNSVPRHWR